MQQMKISVSTSSIIKIILAVLIVWLLFLIRDIVILFFMVLIVAAAFTPLVDWASKYIPRVLTVVLIGLIFFSFVIGIGFLIAPPLVNEIKQLAINLPIIFSKMGPVYHSVQNSLGNYQDSLISLSSQLGKVTSGIYSTTVGLVGGFFAFFTLLILSFYVLIEKNALIGLISNLFSEEKRVSFMHIFQKFNVKMGQWLGGHLLLMLTIGVLDGIVLSILGIPYALILAIWGGLVEIVPFLGSWLGVIPAAIIAYTVSPLTGLFVVIAYIIIQLLESNILAPKILGKAVGLSPVIIILSLLAGAKLLGLLGVIIAVPLAATISILIQEWPEITKLRGDN